MSRKSLPKTKPKDAVLSSNVKRTALGGLVCRKECWRLSGRGWLVLLLAGGAVFFALMLGVHPFLAVTERVEKEHLAVEGWIPAYAVSDAWQEFTTQGYARIFTTGGPVAGAKEPDAEYYTYAQLAGSRLREKGVARELVVMVPAPDTERDRTYTSALALRRWFQEKGVSVKAINVVTLGVHGRRTRMLYERAFGKGVKVGVISMRNREYEAGRWWKYSEGVKEVSSESMAYLYARFFF